MALDVLSAGLGAAITDGWTKNHGEDHLTFSQFFSWCVPEARATLVIESPQIPLIQNLELIYRNYTWMSWTGIGWING